jgi:hypothetical protein
MHTLFSKDSEIIGLDSESFEFIVVFKSYFEEVLNIDYRKKKQISFKTLIRENGKIWIKADVYYAIYLI